jgi:hypothetical protein
MISKELLSEVLGLKVWRVLGSTENILRYCIYPNKGDEPSEYMFPINIYELAHKCKEWADNTGYILNTSIYDCIPFINITNKNNPINNICWPNICEYKSEPEAIFKACEWILKQKENNE